MLGREEERRGDAHQWGVVAVKGFREAGYGQARPEDVLESKGEPQLSQCRPENAPQDMTQKNSKVWETLELLVSLLLVRGHLMNA